MPSLTDIFAGRWERTEPKPERSDYQGWPDEAPTTIGPDDCTFRMLEPHEIAAGMAFPGTYLWEGTKRERVRLAGNAVTHSRHANTLRPRRTRIMTNDFRPITREEVFEGMGLAPVVDLFAGPGGWDEGLRMLGIDGDDVLGIEWDDAACQTAEAAGHRRLKADVAALNPADFAPCVGVIASPPCQAWSMAGDRKGEMDRAHCHELADRMAAGDDSTDWCEWEDERSPLVCQPVRWVRELLPEWIALEEVPPVASLWEHFARIYRAWGYSVWTGDLNAADFGVPQTRRRRVLIASRVRKVGPPAPTHSQDAHGDDLFGGATKRWVTMADALWWSEQETPSDPHAGGGLSSDTATGRTLRQPSRRRPLSARAGRGAAS